MVPSVRPPNRTVRPANLDVADNRRLGPEVLYFSNHPSVSAAFLPRYFVAQSRRTSDRNCGAASSADGPTAFREATAIERYRSLALGLAVPNVARLALRLGYRQTRDSHRLAS